MLRTAIVVALVSAGCCLALAAPQVKAETASPKTKKAKTAAVKPVEPIKIPATAVKTNDGYRWVDPQGKVWIFRETPFGVTKAPEVAKVIDPTANMDPDANVNAVMAGSLVRFSRPTPFGMTTWEKRESDLTPSEQKIWLREQAKRKQ